MLALVKIIRHLVVHIESRVYIHCVLLFFLFRFCCCSAHFSPPRSIRSPFSFPIHCLKEQLSKVFFCSKSTHRKRNFCIGYVCTMYIYSLNQSRAADQTKKKSVPAFGSFSFSLSLLSFLSANLKTLALPSVLHPFTTNAKLQRKVVQRNIYFWRTLYSIRNRKCSTLEVVFYELFKCPAFFFCFAVSVCFCCCFLSHFYFVIYKRFHLIFCLCMCVFASFFSVGWLIWVQF